MAFVLYADSRNPYWAFTQAPSVERMNTSSTPRQAVNITGPSVLAQSSHFILGDGVNMQAGAFAVVGHDQNITNYEEE